MGFAEAKAACEGRGLIVETNTRSFIKAGKLGAIEAMLPGGVGNLLGQSQRQQNKAREAYSMLRNWVFSATDAIATRCAGQPWMAGHYEDKPQDGGKKKRRRKCIADWYATKHYDIKSQGQPGGIKPDDNHAVLWLLDKPNKIQGRYEFVYITIMNLLLTGEWYWIGGVSGDGKSEVWAVPSSWIVPDHSKGLFGGYKLQTGYGEGIPLAPENVARGYFPDPSDIKGCLSPLASCLKAARIDDHILNSQENSFKRGINPNVVIKVAQSLGPDGKPSGHRPRLTGRQSAQLRRAVQYLWDQNVNNGMPAIIDGIVEDIFKLQNTPQEMNWTDSGTVVKGRIFQAFKVNPIIVGEITPANKAQAVVAETNLCNTVVNPLLGNISSAASEFFTPFYEDGESLAVYLEKAVPKDDEREDRQWSDARRNSDVTQDEVRSRLKLEPLKQKPPRSPLFNNPQVLAAIANVAAQVTAGAISHDNGVAMLVTTLQISEEDADAMVPDDPPEPTPEELAAQAAAQNPMAGAQGPPQPGGPPPGKEYMEALAKSLAGMLTLKWSEEEHPRDEGGRFTDSPGQSMLPGLEDANKPGDNPQASLTERAVYAVKRSDELIAKAIENGDTVNVASSWDDLDDTTKSEAESSWIEDHLSDYEEPYHDEWRQEIENEVADTLSRDVEFGKQVFVDWAEDQGYLRESAEEAYQGQSNGLPDIDHEQLAWAEEEESSGKAGDDFKSRKGEMISDFQEKFQEEAESRAQSEIDAGPQESFEGAYSDASEAFGNLDDEDKLALAGVDQEATVEEPTNFEPISDGKDYEKTRTVVRYLQNKIMEKELEARGIENADKVDEEKVAAEVWSSWKGSSTSPTGLLMQYATAQELGGHTQEWSKQQLDDIGVAARKLSYQSGGNNSSEGSDSDVFHRDAQNVLRGIEIAKAHVHATWASTQYAMQKAKMEHLDVYRGVWLDVSKEKIESTPRDDREYHRLSEMKIKRYGAASTTTDRSTANDWGGVGQKPENSERVVMRIRAPREAIVSIPAFGQNVHDEEEVVLAGTKNWIGWDAWKGKAPSVQEVAIKRLRRIMVVAYNPDQPRVPAGQPGGGQFASDGSGGGSGDSADSDATPIPDSRYSGWKPKWKEKPDAQAFIDAKDKSTRGGYLSKLSPDDLKDHKLILSDDGTVGAAVSPDGDVQNVFNNGGPKGAASEALIQAINAGGKTLDCYADYLPQLYHQFGFEETGRMKFNREYAPPGWDYEKLGEPDVVFMARKGGKIDNEHAEQLRSSVAKPKSEWAARKVSGTYYDDWDKAKADSRGTGDS